MMLLLQDKLRKKTSLSAVFNTENPLLTAELKSGGKEKVNISLKVTFFSAIISK